MAQTSSSMQPPATLPDPNATQRVRSAEDRFTLVALDATLSEQDLGATQ